MATTLTYGVLPDKSDFVKRVEAEGPTYSMTLGRTDEEIADEYGLRADSFDRHGKPSYHLTPDELYDFVAWLADTPEDEDEETTQEYLSFASGILTTLGYEWL